MGFRGEVGVGFKEEDERDVGELPAVLWVDELSRVQV